MSSAIVQWGSMMIARKRKRGVGGHDETGPIARPRRSVRPQLGTRGESAREGEGSTTTARLAATASSATRLPARLGPRARHLLSMHVIPICAPLRTPIKVYEAFLFWSCSLDHRDLDGVQRQIREGRGGGIGCLPSGDPAGDSRVSGIDSSL